MNNKLVLAGGGGHCISVLDSLIRTNRYGEIVITDNDLPRGTNVMGATVVGTDDELSKLYEYGYRQAFVTVGSIHSTSIRRKVAKRLEQVGFECVSITDSTADISVYADYGKGTFLGKNSIVNANVSVDDYAIINTNAVIEHECNIGRFTHISIGAVICGGCTIEDDVFIGANATVIQGVRIGMNSIIGAGSIILADVPDNTTVTGVWGGQFLSRYTMWQMPLESEERCVA